MSRNWELGAPAWENRGIEGGGGYRYLPLTNTAKDGSSWHVARIYVDEDDAEMLDDARLIEAAPKLLAACELLIALEDNDAHEFDTRWKDVRKMMRAAVTAAKEEQT